MNPMCFILNSFPEPLGSHCDYGFVQKTSKYGHANSRHFLAVPHHHAALVVLPAMLTTGDLHEFLLGLVHARHGTRPAFEGRCP